jgi:tripartite-type tricarboxylate transporter receptor subunit TctC
MARYWIRAVLALAGLALAAGPAPAAAQAWPARPIKLVIPFAPGGATDIIGRLVAQRLSERLGQPVVIENKPGAGTTIGSAVVAKASPDGYTLLLAPTPFVISQVMYADLPYDGRKDFAPVALLARSPFILVIHPAVPAKNVAELVALARENPGSLTFCTAGNGTVPHLAGEMFKLRAGIDILHVPYKGGGPAIVDLLSGQVAMMFATPIEVDQHVQAGKLRVLATTAVKRLATMPDVPTIEESGYPAFEVYAFFGMLAPAGTPKEIVVRLASELDKVMELPDVRERFAAQSALPDVRGPDAFAAFLRAERDKWAATVRESGAKVD